MSARPNLSGAHPDSAEPDSEARNLPATFLGVLPSSWSRKRLRLFLRLLSPNAKPTSDDSKVELCAQLLSLRPGRLTHNEKAALLLVAEHGRHALNEAQAMLRGNKYYCELVQSNLSNRSKQLLTSLSAKHWTEAIPPRMPDLHRNQVNVGLP